MTEQTSSEIGIQLLTIKQVASILSLSEMYVYRLTEAGKLPSVRIGKHAVRVERGALERWVAEHTTMT